MRLWKDLKKNNGINNVINAVILWPARGGLLFTGNHIVIL
jgi:hypothetical protein